MRSIAVPIKGDLLDLEEPSSTCHTTTCGLICGCGVQTLKTHLNGAVCLHALCSSQLFNDRQSALACAAPNFMTRVFELIVYLS